MTPEQENFDELRRLLKLKRWERPPTGYFNDFSGQVIAQIKVGTNEDHEHVFERMSWEVPWLQRLVDAFQAKPALAVGFGAAVCALLVGGVIYSESLEYQPMPMKPQVEDLVKVAPAPAVSPNFGLGSSGGGALAAITTNNNSLNVNHPSGGSLFDQFQPTNLQLIGSPSPGIGK